ncbi:hypothetical protein FDO65_06865 [Nakamurella flava]|uniref:Uncharacterized protein n=1 Tax=Nakamurella flava TaxID=2576308 RepID=A0A4U6QME4_9ACTN|nr:hypothetical protein [Nakamurella flava]TKV61318.1 hypothetical protein FDO65_06865 [Nakamurella flava]
MVLGIPRDRAIRGSDLDKLVAAVVFAGPEDETYSVEWKSRLDLQQKEGQFALSKEILGMANRSVSRAAEEFEGTGYIVVGASSGETPGVEAIDSATLRNSLGQYLGDGGPDWRVEHVPVGTVNVSVFVVERPRDGDRIHTLRKSATGISPAAQEGAIYVRQQTSVGHANTEQIRMLEARLLAGAVDPVVPAELIATGSLVAYPFDRSPQAVARVLESEQARLTALGNEAEEKNRPAVVLGWTAPRESEFPWVLIRRYLEELGESLVAAAEDEVRDQLGDKFPIWVRNTSGQAMRDVRATIRLPVGITPVVLRSTTSVPRDPKFGRPVGLDLANVMDWTPQAYYPAGASVYEDSDGRQVVTADITLIHAHGKEVFERPLVLIAEPDTEGGEIEWEVTASSHSGVAKGSIRVELSEAQLDLGRIFRDRLNQNAR